MQSITGHAILILILLLARYLPCGGGDQLQAVRTPFAGGQDQRSLGRSFGGSGIALRPALRYVNTCGSIVVVLMLCHTCVWVGDYMRAVA